MVSCVSLLSVSSPRAGTWLAIAHKTRRRQWACIGCLSVLAKTLAGDIFPCLKSLFAGTGRLLPFLKSSFFYNECKYCTWKGLYSLVSAHERAMKGQGAMSTYQDFKPEVSCDGGDAGLGHFSHSRQSQPNLHRIQLVAPVRLGNAG